MSELKQYEEKDPTFVRDLMKSHDATWRVARWIQEREECTVKIFPVIVRPDVEDMAEYSDHGDLDIIVDGDAHRTDVKRLGFRFAGAFDYKYPEVMVCNCHVWDKGDPKPHTFILTDTTMKAAVIVRGSSSSSWRIKEFFDSQKGRDRRAYMCPLDQVQFVEVSLRSDQD